eukprot:6001261-Pleurochrysis_carterae.AAC.1
MHDKLHTVRCCRTHCHLVAQRKWTHDKLLSLYCQFKLRALSTSCRGRKVSALLAAAAAFPSQERGQYRAASAAAPRARCSRQ